MKIATEDTHGLSALYGFERPASDGASCGAVANRAPLTVIGWQHGGVPLSRFGMHNFRSLLHRQERHLKQARQLGTFWEPGGQRSRRFPGDGN